MNAEPVDFNCRADSVKPRPTGARFEEAEREADERRAKERAPPGCNEFVCGSGFTVFLSFHSEDH